MCGLRRAHASDPQPTALSHYDQRPQRFLEGPSKPPQLPLRLPPAVMPTGVPGRRVFPALDRQVAHRGGPGGGEPGGRERHVGGCALRPAAPRCAAASRNTPPPASAVHDEARWRCSVLRLLCLPTPTPPPHTRVHTQAHLRTQTHAPFPDTTFIPPSIPLGLGYYRRARYLLEGAQYVVGQLGGTFPTTAKELLKIPGGYPWDPS